MTFDDFKLLDYGLIIEMITPFDFVYTHAIVCRVPNSFKDGSFKGKEIKLNEAINITKAKEQHNEYISTLR